MTLEEKRIEHLYDLMYKIRNKDPGMAAVLHLVILDLERALK